MVDTRKMPFSNNAAPLASCACISRSVRGCLPTSNSEAGEKKSVRGARLTIAVSVVGAALAAAAFLAEGALAQAPPRIDVDGSDSPLVIRAFIGEEPGLIGALRLHGIGDVGSFQALFSDLKQEGGQEVVPRAHISLLGTLSLATDEYEDLQVKVEGITVPGTYTGKVELLPHGQPRAQATVVVLRVTALGRPVLTAIAPNDRVRGSLAHCGLSCAVTSWLVPGSAGRRNRQSGSPSVRTARQPSPDCRSLPAETTAATS
jgi:hypothetical protein